MRMQADMHKLERKEQRTACQSLFSLGLQWVPGMELGSSVLAASTFTSWAISEAFVKTLQSSRDLDLTGDDKVVKRRQIHRKQGLGILGSAGEAIALRSSVCFLSRGEHRDRVTTCS